MTIRCWEPRIHGEVLKLGFEVAQSSAKYMVMARPFLRNHAPDIAAMDLLVGPSIGFDLSMASSSRDTCHVAFWHEPADPGCPLTGRFSNRPFGVKRFQTIHHSGVDVARGLVLLFGIDTGPAGQVRRQTKRSYATAEAAETAGMVIKKDRPIVRVSVYDSVGKQNH